MTRSLPVRSAAGQARRVLSDALWEAAAPLLPPPSPRGPSGGRPPADRRAVLSAILFVLKTGCQWNALNATGLASSSTAHRRYREWRALGVFERLREALKGRPEARGIDWSGPPGRRRVRAIIFKTPNV